MVHILGDDIIAAAEHRVGLRRVDERDGGAGARAEAEQRRVSRGGADGGDVRAHLLGAVNRLDRLPVSYTHLGPMGCQTGFYLLVRNADNAEVLRQVRLTLMKILAHEGPVFGASSRECGNYRSCLFYTSRCV